VISRFLFPIVLTLAGTVLARRLVPDSGRAERLGLAILLGLGAGTSLLFLAGWALVPLNKATVFCLLVFPTAFLLWLNRNQSTSPISPQSSGSASPPWTPAEAFVLLLIATLFLLSAVKGNFYPITALDAHSYDGRARWMAAEGTLEVSAYRELKVQGRSNLTYPPNFPLSLALGYWAGADQGKAIDLFFFAAALLVLFGFLRRHLPRIGALLATLALAATPEFWNHASLALTNLPAASFYAAGMLLAIHRAAAFPPSGAGAPPSTAKLSIGPAEGLLLAFAAGVRQDATVLTLVAALVLVLVFLPREPVFSRIRSLTWLVGPSVLMTLSWQLYLKTHLGVLSNEPFRKNLLGGIGVLPGFVGTAAFILGYVPLYGWILYFFLAFVLMSLLERRPSGGPDEFVTRRAFRVSLCVLAATFGALVGLFNLLDPAFGGGTIEILDTSFKRDIFYLVPLMIAATGLAPSMRALMERIDGWQRSGFGNAGAPPRPPAHPRTDVACQRP
jgi:hypothetical protein